MSLNVLWFRCLELSCRIFTMFKCLNLLLLLCLFTYSETTTITVIGIKGGNITLSCDFEDKDIVYIELSRFSKNILSCQNEECETESENGRLFKEGSCKIIIKDLRLSDAGKYILTVYSDDGQTEMKMYQLCIHDEIYVKKGEELKMDVLLFNADKVQHQSRRSTGWKEDWKRGEGVQNDRMTFRDGNLIINNFTVTDTGTYEVLDTEGEILIMVTVRESSAGSVDKLSYINDDKTYKAQQHTPSLPPVEYWIFPVGLSVLVALFLVAVKRQKIHRCSGAQWHIY